MTVTIIIPVYNVSSYIERCLGSVLKQDFTPLECILVDDASPDDSMDKVKALLADYQGPITFKLIRHEVNKGLSAARNTGILESSGDYLFFLDGDDDLMESGIGVLANLVVRCGNPDLVQGSSILIGEKSGSDRYQIQKNIPEFTTNRVWLRKQLLKRKKIPVTAWNKLIRRDFLIENQLFFKEGVWHEDEHWTYFSASKVRSMAFCQIPTYEHFITSGSIMTTSGQRSIDSWFEILEDFIAHQGLDSRLERNTILELLFCQLVRIVLDEASMSEPNLNRVQSMAEVCRKSSLKRQNWIEIILLWCYQWPQTWMKVFRNRWVRSIYFRMLRWFA
jgi:glycosyltransferase involved in cell wall biosynthesis